MATVIETVERDGRTIAVYDNGMERDVNKGHLLRPPTAALITKENANAYHRARQEKTAALLRKRITEATNKVSTLQHAGSASAVADTGGILWEEIVLNPDAYHRDRLEAFEKLGKMAQIIPDARQAGEEPAQGAADVLNAATALLTAMKELLHAQPNGATDAQVLGSDIPITNNLRIDEPSTASPTGESEDE